VPTGPLAPIVAVLLAAAMQPTPAAEEALPSLGAVFEIRAVVHADSLEFKVVPEQTHIGPSRPDQRVEHLVERTNLPDRVQPNVVYRDVTVKLTVRGDLTELKQILEAIVPPGATDGGSQTTPNQEMP
jgi:hypothetical protein